MIARKLEHSRLIDAVHEEVQYLSCSIPLRSKMSTSEDKGETTAEAHEMVRRACCDSEQLSHIAEGG